MTLARDSALLTGAQVYYKLTGFLVFPLLAASLPGPDVGLLFFAISTAQLLLVLASGNGALLVVRRLRAGRPLAGEIPPFVAFRLLAAPLFLAACALAALILRPSAAGAMLAAAGFILLEDLYSAAAALLVAADRTPIVVRIGIVVQTAYLAALWLGLRAHPALETVFAAQFLRTGCLVVAGAWAVSRLTSLAPRRRPGFLEGLAPFALLLAAGALFGEVDPLILGLLTSLDEVARYGLAQKIVAGTFFFPGVLATVYYARHAASDTAESRRVLRRLLLLVAAAGLSGAILLALAAGPITLLLFPRSPGVAEVAVALSPCILLGGLTILATAAAQAVGRERGALGALLAGALVGMLGDALLVPWRGAVGAALARSAGTLVQLALLAVLLLRARRVAVPSGSP